MFRTKKQRRRRSEMRLGVQSIDYKTSTTRSGLSMTPALKFGQAYGARLGGVLMLVLLAWLIYLLFSRPEFFVYGAEIKGNVAVSRREIYNASGIDSQSVFWLSSAEIAGRVKTLPNIKSVAVSISLPAEVVIEVVERRPELIWQTGDTVWWVDQEGTIVPPKEEVEGMLHIIDDDRQPLEAGYQIDPAIIKGAQVLRVLAPAVSVIRYSRANGLTVATAAGWPVYLGEGHEIKAKLVVLTAILGDLKERNITPAYIDVRNPLRPVYLPNSIIQIGQPAGVPVGPPAIER
ncbi:MAG: FtsQ-type POTRA domain-containing protein [Chloroflexota bacterium]